MLVLLRHAKSQDQEENRLSGQHNCPLSFEGREQAVEVAVDLSKYEFDAVFSSDLERCVQTTDEILQYNLNLVPSLTYVEELRERSGGILEGMPYKEIRQEIPPKKYKLWERDYFEPVPMGESLKDVEDRVIPYMKAFVFPLVNQGKNVLVVTHEDVIRTIIGFIKGSDESTMVSLTIENAIPYILYGRVKME